MDATGELTLAVGLSLRELIHDYRHQTLVLFKCCLLQPKVISSEAGLSQTADPSQMLFFGSRCEKLCMMQFALISLIPGLLRKLEDCADPEFDSYEKKLMKPTSLRTSDRRSCMSVKPCVISSELTIVKCFPTWVSHCNCMCFLTSAWQCLLINSSCPVSFGKVYLSRRFKMRLIMIRAACLDLTRRYSSLTS